MQLWQTRLLRFSKLDVADEIENFSHSTKALFCRKYQYCIKISKRSWKPVSSKFFRMGNWIGGDRDGNPNVTDQTLDLSVKNMVKQFLDIICYKFICSVQNYQYQKN